MDCRLPVITRSDPHRQASGLPPPLGHQGEAFLRALGGGARPTQRCSSGGYKIRPYRPAPGFPVRAGFMPARTGFRFPPGFNGSIPRMGAHFVSATLRVQSSPPTAAGVGRHAHMPPWPGCDDCSLRWFRGPRCGGVWAPRPTASSRELRPGNCGAHGSLRTRNARPFDRCVRRWCIRHGGTGGNTGRPYNPASGFLVGQAPFALSPPSFCASILSNAILRQAHFT